MIEAFKIKVLKNIFGLKKNNDGVYVIRNNVELDNL